MKHRRRKTALLSAAAAAVLALQGSFAALAASPQFAYDADTWAKLQDNVMEYSDSVLSLNRRFPVSHRGVAAEDRREYPENDGDRALPDAAYRERGAVGAACFHAERS